MTGQLYSISSTTLQVRVQTQLNTALFAKTLVRKDVPSSTPGNDDDDDDDDDEEEEEKLKEDDFSSKAQIMTLMTTDVDRVSEFADHSFSLIGMAAAYLLKSLI